MKVCADVLPNTLGRGIHRVTQALERTAPDGVELVSASRADLQVLHVIGAGSLEHLRPGIPYAMIQYCYQTSEHPSLDFWGPLWERAEAVVSYYDLRRTGYQGDNLLRLPLGVDGEVFKPSGSERTYTIMTSGYVAGVGEALEECYRATVDVGGRVFHLGPQQPELMVEPAPVRWTAREGISDSELAGWYSRCQYVSGLRFTEGFELPVIEGLACGTRPVCFDLPDYRHWFDDHAVFVPHVNGEALTRALTAVLSDEPVPVSGEERRHILETFSWEAFGHAVWRAIL